MSEPELAQQLPNNATQGDEPEEEISWADAMEDLERQKQLIQEQAKAQAPSAASVASAPKPSPRRGLSYQTCSSSSIFPCRSPSNSDASVFWYMICCS